MNRQQAIEEEYQINSYKEIITILDYIVTHTLARQGLAFYNDGNEKIYNFN